MSATDLLPAIRALPLAERVRLLHLLVDDVAQPESTDVPDELRALLPPAGAAIPTAWPVTTDAAGWAAIEAALAEMKGTAQ